MKLALALGVLVVDDTEAEPDPLTPPVALTSEAGPLPFAQCGARSVCSIEADATTGPRAAAETTAFVNGALVD